MDHFVTQPKNQKQDTLHLKNQMAKMQVAKRHLLLMIKDKPVEDFQTSLKSLEGQQTLIWKSVVELALKCSNQVALGIAQKNEHLERI